MRDIDASDLTPQSCATVTRGIFTLMAEAEQHARAAVKVMTFHDYLIWQAVSGPLVSLN